MSTLFFLYDRCVRKEFDARKELFDAKRQFVRFVSHEVRTPLNSVSMGLTLMNNVRGASAKALSGDHSASGPAARSQVPAAEALAARVLSASAFA